LDACNSGRWLTVDVTASRRERSCHGESSAKPQGKKRNRTAIPKAGKKARELDMPVCLMYLLSIKQLNCQTNHIEAVEIKGDYGPTVSNVDKY
jgi:hypothetical protein